MFIDEMAAVRKELEGMGHEIQMPPLEISDGDGKMIPVQEYYAIRKAATDDHSWVWKRKAEAIRMHFDKVVWSDAILVCNYDKKDIPGYVGANTLLEMGLAFHLDKPIFLLRPIPDVSYKEEILGMQPTVINNVLTDIV